MSEAGPEQDAVGRRLETESETVAPDAATLAKQREQAQRRADFQRGGLAPEDRAAGEARLTAEFQERNASIDWGGISDGERAAAEARQAQVYQQQRGSVASRLDPEGRASDPVRGAIDTGAEVHKFTGEGQDALDPGTSKGSDGEADRTGGSSISARLSGLDSSRDERDGR